MADTAEKTERSKTLPAPMDVAQNRSVMPLVPKSTSDITRMAKFLVDAGAAPGSYKGNVQAVSVAIIKGLEIGWLPTQAVQNMYVINGIPTIYGDGAMALVRASGELKFCRERIEGDGDNRKGVCEVLRDGEDEPIVREFTMAQAVKAGLTGKQGPWKQYPERMLQMRARSWALRDGFADVLMGLRIAEEVQDYTPVPEDAPAREVSDPLADEVAEADRIAGPAQEPVEADFEEAVADIPGLIDEALAAFHIALRDASEAFDVVQAQASLKASEAWLHMKAEQQESAGKLVLDRIAEFAPDQTEDDAA